MKRLLAIALVSLASLAEADSRKPPRGISLPRGCRDRSCARERTLGDDYVYAFFEFAPESGAGMTAACACTTPTGAKGEAMTFTRASSGTCLKGGTTTGIANGDLVTCSTDEPRVMPGGDGTGGSGLLVEGARTNLCLRSDEIDHAAWAVINFGGSSSPTVTADQAVGPDGTTTADRVQVAAAGVGAYSLVRQAGMAGSGSGIGSFFLKGNAESGTLHLLVAGATVSCVSCSYNATTWSRCSTGAATDVTTIYFGNDDLDCGGGAQGAKDVFVSGVQVEDGAFASSYIKTEGAAVTRAAEAPSFSIALTNTTGSFAGTVVLPAAVSAGDHGVVALSVAGPAYRFLLDYASTPAAFLYTNFGTGGSVSSGYAITPGAHERFAGYWDAANRSVVTPSGSNTNAIPAGAPSTTLAEVGCFSAGGQIDGVVKRVCVDPSPTRCR